LATSAAKASCISQLSRSDALTLGDEESGATGLLALSDKADDVRGFFDALATPSVVGVDGEDVGVAAGYHVEGRLCLGALLAAGQAVVLVDLDDLPSFPGGDSG
jgi:hypothetical protein